LPATKPQSGAGTIPAPQITTTFHHEIKHEASPDASQNKLL
jgi:hypothetical protein